MNCFCDNDYTLASFDWENANSFSKKLHNFKTLNKDELMATFKLCERHMKALNNVCRKCYGYDHDRSDIKKRIKAIQCELVFRYTRLSIKSGEGGYCV